VFSLDEIHMPTVTFGLLLYISAMITLCTLLATLE